MVIKPAFVPMSIKYSFKNCVEFLHLNQRAVAAGENFQVWNVDEDGPVDVLEAIAAQVKFAQILKLVKYPWGQL